MLLAAVIAAMLVVADQLIETWADGHLLVVWVVLWAVTFGVLSFLMQPLRLGMGNLLSKMEQWSARQAQLRAEDELWRYAQHDHRLRADLRVSLLCSQHESP